MSCAEEKLCSEEEKKPWSYLFVHHSKVETVLKKLEDRFPVFVHKSIVHKQEKKHVKSVERPTIAGLVFVQGRSKEIQSFLNEHFIGIYLVNDCSTCCPATISDKVMQTFMQFSKLSPNRIRFMPHSFDYYSEGHSLVRITSGPLSGMEGYQVRISRDRCFITTLGGMTVAVGGVVKETFENVEEYVKQRKMMQKTVGHNQNIAQTPLQQEIDKNFFFPQNQLDVVTILGNLDSWFIKIDNLTKEERYEEAVEMTFFLLQEIGCYFAKVIDQSVYQCCHRLGEKLLAIYLKADVPDCLRSYMSEKYHSICACYTILRQVENLLDSQEAT